MRLCVLDTETFYDSKGGYTLRKMTTEQYINDFRFHLFGFSVMVDGGKPYWVDGENAKAAFDELRLDECAVISHNAKFDMAILNWKYGVRPKRILDTLSMARGLFGNTESLSLSALAEKLGVGVKGEVIGLMDGVRHPDPELKDALIGYCDNDVQLTWDVYNKLAPGFPAAEKVVIDLTVRMFTEPSFELDREKIEREIELTNARRETLLEKAGCQLSDLRSDAKFAALLESLGVVPPKKLSAKKSEKAGKPVYTWAFAKSDPDFKTLLDHDNELVQWACEARLGLKSTIKESRAQRFLGVCDRMGKMPIALEYCGANTGRYAASSSEKVNAQNLPAIRGSKDPDAGLLRKSLAAPKGHVVVVSDASQIEARFVAWLAGQDDLVEAFAQGRDVYSEMATKIYGRHVDRKKNPDDFIPGFLGKCVTLGCIEEGSLVLTDRGLVPIEQVTTCMRVWDGVEWVSHDGPVFQGVKEVITYDSLTATPDHIVYLQSGAQCRFDRAAEEELSIARTGDGGTEIRYGGDNLNGGCETTPAPGVRAHEMRTVWDGEANTVQQLEAGANERMPEVQSAEACPEVAGRPCHGHETAVYESEGQGVEELWGARDSIRVPVCDRRGPVDNGASGGAQGHGAGSGGQQLALRAGEFEVGDTAAERVQHEARGVGSGYGTVQIGTPQCTVRGQHAQELVPHRADSSGDSGPVGTPVVQTKRRVWDILNAGPRNRFTVSGRLVHNCGYSMSFFKFGQTVYGGMLGGPQILFDEDMAVQLRVDRKKFAAHVARRNEVAARVMESKPAVVETTKWLTHLACAQKIVNTYRDENPRVPEYWALCSVMIDAMHEGDEIKYGPLKTAKDRMILPNGMSILYKGLERGKDGYTYLRRKEGRVQRVKIYGGSLTENICQALAGAYVKEAMVRMYVEYGHRTILQVHDEVVVLSPENTADKTFEEVSKCMTTVPSWAYGLPLASEGDFATAYGFAK